jgi:hypothetical protein
MMWRFQGTSQIRNANVANPLLIRRRRFMARA